jgi:hypothetical protein
MALLKGNGFGYFFDRTGSYHVSLTVNDKDGGSTTQTSLVKVDNVAPTVNINAFNLNLAPKLHQLSIFF